MSTSSVSLDDVTMLKRIKLHIKECDCCRTAILEGSNNND
jgi:hypothetical protein